MPLPIQTGMTRHPVLGVVTPDIVGVILQTGFLKFCSPVGIDGLAKWDDTRLELLSIIANHPGTGQFRQFINQCKSFFAVVIVWEVWNETLPPVLIRYGFKPYEETQEDNAIAGEILTGYKWTA